MRKIPSFSALRAFESAARLGGFAYAAKELHLTPSAVSHQIKSLENYFGQALFIRRHRHVALTTEGARLLNGLTDAFDTIEAACTALSPQPQTDTLSVHCTPSFASKWLGPRLPTFLKRHPAIRLQFTSSADPVDLLRRNDLDMVIAYGAAPRQPGVEVLPLGIERIAVLCAPSVAYALSATQWREINLIESVMSPVRWEDWLASKASAHPSSHSRSSFDRGALAIAAATQGLGVALETTRFAEVELASGELVEPGEGSLPFFERELHFLCYREADKTRQNIRVFRAWLLRQAHMNTDQ